MDGNGYIKGGCLLDCLEWLQSLHEGFKCTGNLIPDPFDLEKVWATMKRQVAGGRFKRLGTLVNIGGFHWAAVYVSKKDKALEYFDPMGHRPNARLVDLLGTVSVRVGEELGVPALKIYISKGVHQTEGVQCGLYSLTYILRRLTGTAGFTDFSEGPRITREVLEDVASTYFA
jgi:hypothetical protein